MEYAAKSHVGLVRSVNEDGYWVRMDTQPYKFIVVADGMGGHLAGEVASQLTLQVISRELLNNLPEREYEDIADFQEWVIEAILAANREVYEESVRHSGYSGMGTTVVVAIISESSIFLAYIGDSRGYLLRNGDLRQLTEDHSLVQELYKSGQLTEAETHSHPQRNIITRAIGTEESVIVDSVYSDWHEGDVLMICSDGLSDLLLSSEIEQLLNAPTPLQERVDLLVEQALYKGGNDNITVVAVKNTGGETT